MERYSAYKDSGVDWIGEIPAGWDVRPLCRDFQIVAGATPKSGVEAYWNGNIPWITPADLGTKNIAKGSRFITQQGLASCGTTLVPVGSIVVSNRAPIGQVAITTQPLCTNQGCKCLVPDGSINSTYVYYYLSHVAGPLNAYGQGTTFLELSRAALASFPCPIPNISEQQAIADYLDEKTGAIDAAVKDIERSIELLNEYRQSVISEAVTKGLDPTAPMKDSGIDWIGQVPDTWSVHRGKTLFCEVDNRSEMGDEELLTVSHITGVTPRSQKNVNMFMAETFEGYKKCEKCDIAANTMWLWQGAIGVSPVSGIISPSYNVYRQRKAFYLPDYLDMLLRTPNLIETYRAHSSGITKSRLRLYPQEFLNIRFPVPPIDEQYDIVHHLKNRVKELDSLIQQKQSLLVWLKEYRASLISECVTGKVKVPGVTEE